MMRSSCAPAPAPHPPIPLPQSLVDAASETARKVAVKFTTAPDKLLEIEADHCHYHGTSGMSFTYPLTNHQKSYYSGAYRGIGLIYRRFPDGLYMGARDLDLLTPEHLVLQNDDDEALIMEAVNAVKKRRLDEAKERAAEAAAKARRAKEAAREKFLADL